MSFKEKYADLERLFQHQVVEDREKHDITSIYLPNIQPDSPVDFVFIGMEPSLGRWAPNPENACNTIDNGFKNFAFSIEDFILHYCIEKFLCNGAKTYYLTDLSKGAMLVSEAYEKAQDRYDRWYPLLERELSLVAKPDARIISIGARVGSFLLGKGLPRHYRMIIHYSGQASRYRGREAKKDKKGFKKFCKQMSADDIFSHAKRIMEEANMASSLCDERMKRIRRGKGLTESRRKLMFDYKIAFDSIRKESS